MEPLKTLVVIFLGGGLGSVARYILGEKVSALHSAQFPWGTFAVNVTACFLLGLIVGLAEQKQLLSAGARLFWAVGFCGGFSTFSTFSHETLALLQGGVTGTAVAYIVLSVTLCLLAVYAGQAVAASI